MWMEESSQDQLKTGAALGRVTGWHSVSLRKLITGHFPQLASQIFIVIISVVKCSISMGFFYDIHNWRFIWYTGILLLMNSDIPYCVL